MKRGQIMGAVALGLSVVAGGCRPAGPVRAVDMQPLPTAQAALDGLRAVGAQRKTIRAAGRVTYYGEKGRVRVRLEVVAERADRFRVATVSPFEQPIDVMACDGAQLWLLSKGVLRQGPATPTNVSRLLPLPLHPSEIVDTLMGGIPTGTAMVAKSLERRDDGQWTLTLGRAGGQERVQLTIDPQRQVVLAADVQRPVGTPYLRAEFDDFKRLADGGFYPEKIGMTMPGRDVDVRLKLKAPQINASIDPSLFKISPPPGQAVRSL